jgi:hypothetical protein
MNMSKYVRILVLIALVLLFSTSCKELLQTYVRFQNNSATKTVYAVWDGVNMGNLTPGQTSEYREVNEGTHTIQWKNAATNKDLTTIGWPNLVAGEYYTYPYSD